MMATRFGALYSRQHAQKCAQLKVRFSIWWVGAHWDLGCVLGYGGCRGGSGWQQSPFLAFAAVASGPNTPSDAALLYSQKRRLIAHAPVAGKRWLYTRQGLGRVAQKHVLPACLQKTRQSVARGHLRGADLVAKKDWARHGSQIQNHSRGFLGVGSDV